MNLLPYMEQWNMLPERGGVILCAVSGGRDSMCLLHYLHHLGKSLEFTVAAAHLNHLMRPTAQRDVDFVRGFCRENGIPFYTESTPVYDKAKEWSVTVEEAGRRARYTFLSRTAERIGAEKIATAHHQNDQAETVLLNLLRGTGPEGLGGIPPVRGRYIRPLLQTPRYEIETYLAQNGIDHIEDETNTSRAYARNRLRLDLWPALEELHGGAGENIVRCANIVREENAYLNELAARYLPETGTAIDCAVLREAPSALQGRILRQIMARLPSGKKDVGAVHVEALEKLCNERGTLSLPGGMAAKCDGKTLHIFITEQMPEELTLHPGENEWGGYLVTAMWENGDVVTVRCWRPDDRLILPGSRGARSLKRLFAERGITSPEREQIPVVCVNGTPAAVFAVGQNESFVREKQIRIEIQCKEDKRDGKEQYGPGHFEGSAE